MSDDRMQHPGRPFRARGSFVRRCEACRMPERGCICALRPRLPAAAADIWLMMHPDEVRKPTNTGRLIEECLPGTRRFVWNRVTPDPSFEAALADPDVQPWIVFPAPPDRYEERLIPFQITPGKRPALMLLDGTWQQAGKMFRLTRYLDAFPVLSLQPQQASAYGLRRAVHEGQLCTVEVAAALLRLVGSGDSGDWLERYFRVFSEHYLACRNNQALPISDDHLQLRAYAAGVGSGGGASASPVDA